MLFFSAGSHPSSPAGARIMRSFLGKGLVSLRLLLNLFRLFPLRLVRVVEHVQLGLQTFNRQALTSAGRRRIWSSMTRWWVDCLFLLLDLAGLANLYEILQEWIKPNTRSLYDWEKELARSVFGNSIPYARVRIDEYAVLGPRQHRLCYVSANTINTWGSMDNSLLVHELTHVWQYQQLGLVYIPRALRAQRSRAGYDYGGIERLIRYKRSGKKLLDFNLEQQAEIVTDYYRLREGYPPRWGKAHYAHLPVYAYFVEQLWKNPASGRKDAG